MSDFSLEYYFERAQKVFTFVQEHPHPGPFYQSPSCKWVADTKFFVAVSARPRPAWRRTCGRTISPSGPSAGRGRSTRTRRPPRPSTWSARSSASPAASASAASARFQPRSSVILSRGSSMTRPPSALRYDPKYSGAATPVWQVWQLGFGIPGVSNISKTGDTMGKIR